MLFGAHVSIAGGLDKALSRAEAIGCTAMQSFATSPRMIKFNPMLPETIEQYKFLREQSKIGVHVFHGVYLINLAHENPAYVNLCIESLVQHQRLAREIGVLGTVFHVGSHKGKGFEAVCETTARAIAQIILQSPPEIWLLLENTAGQSGSIGASFNELLMLKKIAKQNGADTSRLGLGVDTQHAFGAGYNINSGMEVERLIQDIDSTWGLKALKVIHVNDSQVPCGSHRDRHANLGEGEIGIKGLAKIINHPRLSNIPLILEVPGEKKSGPRAQDVAALKALFS